LVLQCCVLRFEKTRIKNQIETENDKEKKKEKEKETRMAHMASSEMGDEATAATATAPEVWSEVYICSECFNGMALHNGQIILTTEKGEMVGTISGLRRGNVIAFFQQPMEIFHRTFHNVFYLWIVYESYLDLVYCDAKDGYDIGVGMMGRTVSFYRPDNLGIISKFDVSSRFCFTWQTSYH
jgi:hypothetical protein